MFLTLMLAAGEVAAKAGEAAAAGGEEQTSGLHNFLEIVTKPDNIPIVAMFFIVFYFFGLSMKMGAANDKLTQSGEKEKIYERMNRWVFGAGDEETK
jgi:hypothetical protein